MSCAPVSAIIPCFRCSETVGRAVRSVADQRLRPSELILVDDGSDDEGRTLSALRELQHAYRPRLKIKVIALTTNRGPGMARNAGWEIAQEPVLAFLDADDAWHPQKLAIQYGWMRDRPDVVLSGHGAVRPRGAGEPPSYSGAGTVSEVGAWRLLFSNIFAASSVLLRRDVPLRFEPVYSADHLLWLRIVLTGFRAAFLPTPLSYVFKPPYGHSGMSARLWTMERAELENYQRIRRDRLIGPACFGMLSSYSLAKYLRRVMLTYLLGYRRSYAG